MAARKGSEFHAVEVREIAGDKREIEMRIGARVAVAGKMFRGGEAAVFLDAAHEGRDEFRDARGIFAKRARIDDGILRIAVHVGDGRKNPGHAHGSRFERRDFSHRVGVFRASRGGDGHFIGKRRALVDAHAGAALEIRADQQRNFRVALQRVDEDRGRIHLAALHAERRALRLDRERADVLFLDIAQKILVVLAFGGKERAVGPDGEKLPDFFIERHGFECLRDPALALGGKSRRFRRGRRARSFLCAARGSHQEESEQQEPAT